MNNYDCLIIGAGPAGMMAAGVAGASGLKVLLLDKNPMLGKKLRITGKGRCNVTNASDMESILDNIPTNPRFLYSSLNKFDNFQTMDFFEHQGLPLKMERGNRVFPQSDKALDVVLAMERFLKKGNVKFRQETVIEILSSNGKAVGVRTKSAVYNAKCILIATGGKSYPLTGSTGDGYALARKTGHEITALKPSLVPMVCKEGWVKSLQGLSLKNIKITLLGDNKELYTDFGEMLFTHFGVSGPVILSASAHIKDKAQAELLIDLKPALSEEVLDKRLQRDFEKFSNRHFINALGELLPKKLIAVVVKLSGIDENKQVNSITKEERQRLLKVLKELRLTVVGLRPIDEAIITSGGISVKDINPSTMESKKLSGLYFAGEVIDVDAYTGGYNLQIAFSTGHLAGESMVKQIKNI